LTARMGVPSGMAPRAKDWVPQVVQNRCSILWAWKK